MLPGTERLELTGPDAALLRLCAAASPPSGAGRRSGGGCPRRGEAGIVYKILRIILTVLSGKIARSRWNYSEN